MEHQNRNPTPMGRRRARKCDLLATAKISSGNIEAHSLQVKKLIARFGLAPIRAELVARLAYEARP